MLWCFARKCSSQLRRSLQAHDQVLRGLINSNKVVFEFFHQKPSENMWGLIETHQKLCRASIKPLGRVEKLMETAGPPPMRTFPQVEPQNVRQGGRWFPNVERQSCALQNHWAGFVACVAENYGSKRNASVDENGVGEVRAYGRISRWNQDNGRIQDACGTTERTSEDSAWVLEFEYCFEPSV